MGKGAVVRHLALLALFFSLPKVALSSAENQPTQPVRDLRVSDIVISSELGYVIETHQPTSSNPPVIIHIQEAHTNYEAQKHLAGILERLIKQHGLKLILVEGGSGDVSLSSMRRYSAPETRRTVADKYLKAGLIGGEEYLDIVSDYPLSLWGVEDKELYKQNVNAFLEAETFQQSLKPVLASVRDAVEALKARLLSPVLKDLEAKTKAFEEETLGLADYAEYLAGLARRQGISEQGSPHLARFLAVRQLEKGMDLSQVQKEQQALIQRLSQQMSQEELAPLVAMAEEMKAGKATREAFYEKLQQLATTSGHALNQSPSLSRYIHYVKQSAQINPAALANELGAFTTRLREHLASSTPENQQLDMIARQLDLLEKLAELQLAPQEYQQLQALDVEGAFLAWETFLNHQTLQQGLPVQSFSRLEEVEAALPALKRFYEVAAARDTALVENALAKLSETQEPLAVLITGGFHSPQITQLLKDQGVGLILVAPKVSGTTDERLYKAVLKYKSGKGSFEEVMALVGQEAGSRRQ